MSGQQCKIAKSEARYSHLGFVFSLGKYPVSLYFIYLLHVCLTDGGPWHSQGYSVPKAVVLVGQTDFELAWVELGLRKWPRTGRWVSEIPAILGFTAVS